MPLAAVISPLESGVLCLEAGVLLYMFSLKKQFLFNGYHFWEAALRPLALC